MKVRRAKTVVTAAVEDVDLPPDRNPARRPLLVVLLLIVLVLVVRVIWGVYAERRMNAELARLGEQKLLPREGRGDLSGAERDAVRHLNRAAEASTLTADEEQATDEPNPASWPVTDAASAARRAVVAMRAGVFGDLRQARALGPVRWPEAYRSRSGADLAELEDLGRLGALATVLRFACETAHADGDDAAAIRRVREILFVGRATRHYPSSMAPLVASGIDSFAVYELDAIGIQLRVAPSRGGVAEAELRSLIDELCDDREFRGALVDAAREGAGQTVRWVAECRSGRRERVMNTVDSNGMPRTTLAPAWANRASAITAGPYYALEGARALHQWGAIGGALEQASYPSILARLPAPPIPAGAGGRDYLFGADWITREDIQVGNWARAIRIDLQVQMMRHLAASQLATRLYRIRHGRLPSTLAALVPDCSGAVPVDLFASGTPPIRYAPTAAQPFVYSVGENGIDDLAAGTWSAPIGLYLDRRETLPDLIWYVAPPTGAATRPGAATRAISGS